TGSVWQQQQQRAREKKKKRETETEWHVSFQGSWVSRRFQGWGGGRPDELDVMFGAVQAYTASVQTEYERRPSNPLFQLDRDARGVCRAHSQVHPLECSPTKAYLPR
ncbi:hypothetical protein CH063_15419, partial [Colletotrichum higginsianum]